MLKLINAKYKVTLIFCLRPKS